MRRPSRSSAGLALSTLALIAGFVLVAAPAAHAGLGDFVKKAKDKAAQAVGKKAPAAANPVEDEPPVFDDVVVELNDERIARILEAFQAAGAAGAGRPALIASIEKAETERAALLEKHEPAIFERRNKRSEIEVCIQEGLNQARERRFDEYRNRALSDPVLLQKFQKAAADNEAAARGDSAALARIMQVFHEETAPTREDTLQVLKDCGPLPPRLPSEDKLDGLDREIGDGWDKVRQIDGKVADAQTRKGGLNRQQWAMALERIQMYMAARPSGGPGGASGSGGSGGAGGGSGGGSGSGGSGGAGSGGSGMRGFSRIEVEAIEKRLAELRAALG